MNHNRDINCRKIPMRTFSNIVHQTEVMPTVITLAKGYDRPASRKRGDCYYLSPQMQLMLHSRQAVIPGSCPPTSETRTYAVKRQELVPIPSLWITKKADLKQDQLSENNFISYFWFFLSASLTYVDTSDILRWRVHLACNRSNCM